MGNAADPFDLDTKTTPVVAAGIEGDLQPKPRASIGLSKKVVFILGGVGAVFFLIFVMAIDNVGEPNSNTKSKKDEEETKKQSGPVLGGLPSEFKLDKKGSVLQSSIKPPGDEPPANSVPTNGQAAIAVPSLGDKSAGGAGGTSVLNGGSNGKGAVPSQAPAQQNALSPEEQRVAKAKEERAQRESQARLGGLEVKSYSSAGGASGGGGNAAVSKETAIANAVGSRLDALGIGNKATPGSGASMASASSRLPGGSGGSDQDEKLKFLSDSGSSSTGYHPHTVAHPLSRLQLNAGSFIPAVLEMGVNSDLPGMVTARVRENVYDSVTGKCLLMPSGMKVVGGYLSKVSTGQSRQLVVWNQGTYPNGDMLNMAGMGSADVSGQSGLDADVDNHWLRLFGVTLGMSLVTATVQASIPPTPPVTNGNSAPSYAQSVSAALAQQYGQLGSQMMGKYLNVQPTLRNYPGERFNIVVPKNIVFPGCYRG